MRKHWNWSFLTKTRQSPQKNRYLSRSESAGLYWNELKRTLFHRKIMAVFADLARFRVFLHKTPPFSLKFGSKTMVFTSGTLQLAVRWHSGGKFLIECRWNLAYNTTISQMRSFLPKTRQSPQKNRYLSRSESAGLYWNELKRTLFHRKIMAVFIDVSSRCVNTEIDRS